LGHLQPAQVPFYPVKKILLLLVVKELWQKDYYLQFLQLSWKSMARNLLIIYY